MSAMKAVPVLTVALVAAFLAVVAAQPTQRYDLLIRNGRVMDGTGNPWFPADVAVQNGRIVAIGKLGRRAGRARDRRHGQVRHARLHRHSLARRRRIGPRGGFRDDNPARRAAPNLVSQGITTVVVNQDGRSPWPLTDQRAQLEKNGIGPNAMLLVGHGTVRRRVMGDDVRRPARADEITRMRALVKEALQQGAVGMSAGLEYDPGRWSTTEEVVELAKELPAFNGIYISHERSEGSDPLWYVPSQDGPSAVTLLDAVRETIEIGEKAGARVVASHLKAKGEHYWGSSAAAISLIQRARDRGVDVWADQYPYPTSGTDGSTVLIPAWATRPPGAGPNQPPTSRADVLKRVLGDPPSAKLVRSDIAHEIRRRGGAENITVYEFTDKALYGKSLAEIARLWKLDPVEAAIKIQLEGLRESQRRRAHARLLDGGNGHGEHREAAVGRDVHRWRHRLARRRTVHARALLRQLYPQNPPLLDRSRRDLARARDPIVNVAAGADHGPEGSWAVARRLRRGHRDLRSCDDSRQGDLLRAPPAFRGHRLRVHQRHRRRRCRQADQRHPRQGPNSLNFPTIRTFSSN